MAKAARLVRIALGRRPLARAKRVLVSLVVFVGLLVVVAAWPHPKVAELLAAGDLALGRGDLGTAYAKYSQALYRQPEEASIHLKLARLYEAGRDYDQATSELVQAQTLDPSLNLGSELGEMIDRRDEPKALRADLAETTAILSEHPEFRDAWFRAAYLHYRLREDNLAKAALTRTLEIDPNYEPALKLRAVLP